MARVETGSLLVTGASGQLGHRVVELLVESGAGPIVALTRTPEKLRDLAARGVSVRPADLDRATGLESALAGASRMLLVTDAIDWPGRRAQQHGNAIGAAVHAGIGHVVYVSFSAHDPESPVLIAPEHHASEAALAASGLGWTFLRNNLYADDLLRSLPRAVAAGQIVAAAGGGAAAYVTREDCARVAAAVMAAKALPNAAYEVTGPEAVTHAELARIASQVSGRSVVYVPVDALALRSRLVASGLSRMEANIRASFDVGIARGVFRRVTPAVMNLTGHPPMGVAEFLSRHRDALFADAAAA
jgi:NAD(P)H dehydrogenase (quinone)